jgi:hypothetical protein
MILKSVAPIWASNSPLHFGRILPTLRKGCARSRGLLRWVAELGREASHYETASGGKRRRAKSISCTSFGATFAGMRDPHARRVPARDYQTPEYANCDAAIEGSAALIYGCFSPRRICSEHSRSFDRLPAIGYSVSVYLASITSHTRFRVSCGLRSLPCSICCTSVARASSFTLPRIQRE